MVAKELLVFSCRLKLLLRNHWQWLEKILSTSNAKIHLICSSTQVLPTEHKKEKWQDYPDSRDRLFKLLSAKKTPGVFLLSGDRHLGEISRIDLGLGLPPIYEITSSGLTHFNQSQQNESNKFRVGSLYAGLNFGTAEIDWINNKIRFCIRNKNGEPEQSVESGF